MLIKPLEQKQKLSSKIIFLKIGFLISLILTGVILEKIFLSRKPKLEEKILGETKKIEKPKIDFLNETINQAEKKGETVLGEATHFANDFFQETKEKIDSSVSQMIYENSLKKIVDQIDKLPKDQQEKIKKDICQ
jgi:hypothetical protein